MALKTSVEIAVSSLTSVSPLFGEGQRFDEHEGRLEVGSRAEREALLAVVALGGGDLRKEADFFSDPTIDESNGVLLLDFGTVADAETAMNTE